MTLSIKKIALIISTLSISQILYAQAPSTLVIPDPIATVNGKPIPKAEYDKFIKLMGSQGQTSPSNATEAKAIIEDYAFQNILAEYAKKAGIDKTDDFKAQKELIELGLLAQKYIISQIDALKISDTDIQTAYDKYIEDMPQGLEYNASHILVETLEQAEALIKKIAGGLKFEEAAKESKDPGSATQGGSLGWFTPEMMVPEFSTALKSMKKGDISQAPVKSQFGFHIIRLDDSRDPVKPTLESMKPQLESTLKNDKARELINKLKTDAKIEVFIK